MAFWCYQVVDYCNLHRETVEVAISILDRFLCLANADGQDQQDFHPIALQCLEDRKTFQLAAMTCLYTAIKMSEVEVMDPSIVASLSRGMCKEDEVIDMESTILQALDWRINGPTSHAAVDHLVQLLDASCPGVQQQHVKRAIIERARHYVQLAVIEYELMTVRPTLVAYAAIINALESISVYDLTSEDRMAFVSDMTLAVLHPIAQDDAVDLLQQEKQQGQEGESIQHSLHQSNAMIDTVADLRMRLSDLEDGQQRHDHHQGRCGGMAKTASGRCIDTSCSSEVNRSVSVAGSSPRCVVGHTA